MLTTTLETGCGRACTSGCEGCASNPPLLSLAAAARPMRPMLPATRSAGELVARQGELSAELSRYKARAEAAEAEVLRLRGRPRRCSGLLWGLGGLAVGAALFRRR